MRRRISPSTPANSATQAATRSDVAEVDVLGAERREERVVELGEAAEHDRDGDPAQQRLVALVARRARPTAAITSVAAIATCTITRPTSGGTSASAFGARSCRADPASTRRAKTRAPISSPRRQDASAAVLVAAWRRERGDRQHHACPRGCRPWRSAPRAATRRRRRSCRPRPVTVARQDDEPSGQPQWSARERRPHWRTSSPTVVTASNDPPVSSATRNDGASNGHPQPRNGHDRE